MPSATRGQVKDNDELGMLNDEKNYQDILKKDFKSSSSSFITHHSSLIISLIPPARCNLFVENDKFCILGQAPGIFIIT
jgi:hypothetical protein